MPVFTYQAVDAKGKNVRGKEQATDETDLQARLSEKNLYLVSAKSSDKLKNVKQLGLKVLADFCRQLGTLLGSGVSLVRTLRIISETEGIGDKERAIYVELLRSVRQGVTLSESMEQSRGAFPPLLINMIRSAETGGNLDAVAMRMAVDYDKQYKLESKLKSAMTYPKVLVVLCIGVVLIITTYVIPQFDSLFSQMASLPIYTIILIGTGDFIKSKWMWIFIVAFTVYVLGTVVMQVPKIRLRRDKIYIHFPVIGSLMQVIYTARFARTLSSLYSSGIPIITTLQIAKTTIGNTYIEAQFDNMVTQVRAGGNLSDAIESVDGFIKKLTSTVRVGEETGSLDSMLDSTADALEYESEMAINKLVSMLEPAMIVVMALIIGFIMISVITPIYGSYEQIGGGDI